MNPVKEDRWSYLWPAIGALLFVIGNGRWTVPLAAWLWPVFMLRFTRTQRPVRGFIIASVILMAGCTVQWSGIMKGPVFIILNAAMGMVLAATFLIDRIIAPRFKGIVSTFVLPLAWTTMEYLGSFGPFGSWGSLAYTQYGNLPLEQMVSVTGIYGITFLIAWLAAVVNASWQDEFVWHKIRGIVVLYPGILAMVLLLGGARLAFFPVDSKTVRVASVVAPSGENIITMLSFRVVENGFSLVRCTCEGLTMTVDYQGRVLTATDDFRNKEPVIISDVPVKGVPTPYSATGDLFAWLCCAGFVMIAAGALLRRKENERCTG